MATEARKGTENDVPTVELGVAVGDGAAVVGDGAEVSVLAPHPRTWEPKTQLIFM
ncbi:Hypothetical protein SMAX5B_004906 [Scophthalmus maximus]|uniref:Uncharacterized protein n=1 Tax=Scophthalmus maximus TaxID=52904 RepID=A0A2U9BQF9_SCOMX|nr:Hypothetical protein SMAX5B_004906 [Scophthalmus maximus]